MDTKFFAAALEEWMDADPTRRRGLKVQSLEIRELSTLLRRAQELKELDAIARNEENSTLRDKVDAHFELVNTLQHKVGSR